MKSTQPKFAALGDETGQIDVRLSYRIIELFSEGLYASPHKAIEELVANSFDAGALHVQVILSTNLHKQDASIAVIDDGTGMGVDGLKRHWLIGISYKRRSGYAAPRGRQQIGKFGIGKLATYVLAGRLTHISKQNGKYFSTSMDFSAIDKRVEKEVEPKSPISIPLRELTKNQAEEALSRWTATKAFKSSTLKLFGKNAATTWTVSIMSDLKAKVHEIKPGTLRWVLRTALPLRPDFSVWLNGEKLKPSKEGKGLLKRWVLGDDLTKLPKPSPKGIEASVDNDYARSSIHHHGLVVPELGRITGYAEVYEDLLTGKSDELGRSYGFFVYVYGRLVNVLDGHFGIPPNELRHGTFGRFRLVVHIDGLDKELRSNREAISDGPLLSTTQDVLRAIFNTVRPTIEKHDESEEPGAQLARKLAASPASLSRRPIVELARAVIEGRGETKYLAIPELQSDEQRSELIQTLEARAAEGADHFVSGLKIYYDGNTNDGLARYDTETGELLVNAFHPFVATFHDEFSSKKSRQPLEVVAMAEVLLEAHLHALQFQASQIGDLLSLRDQLLRTLANESPKKSPFAIALALEEARNNPNDLEEQIANGFRSLGFDVSHLGGSGKPDGLAVARLPADSEGQPGRYLVSLEAKSKKEDKGKIAAATVNISTITRHRDQYHAHHAIVIGRDFPIGDDSALETDIQRDREASAAKGEPKTVTLITIDTLAELIRLRPVKQVGLRELRELFNCTTHEASAAWVEGIKNKTVEKPPYARIIRTIETLQIKREKATVKYGTLANELSHLDPPIHYATDNEVADVCRALAQMAGSSMHASEDSIEIDQSAENVIAAVDAAFEQYN